MSCHSTPPPVRMTPPAGQHSTRVKSYDRDDWYGKTPPQPPGGLSICRSLYLFLSATSRPKTPPPPLHAISPAGDLFYLHRMQCAAFPPGTSTLRVTPSSPICQFTFSASARTRWQRVVLAKCDHTAGIGFFSRPTARGMMRSRQMPPRYNESGFFRDKGSPPLWNR